MDVRIERTRLLFTNYTDTEKRQLQDMVASMDTIFLYEDADKRVLGLPPGILSDIKKNFPRAKYTDASNEYWPYDRIHPVSHSAKPRNQLQTDFISYLINESKRGNKVGGILSTGTGKGLPLNTMIPTPEGNKMMKDIKVGDQVFGSDGKPTTVVGVYPQGRRDVYRMFFSDGKVCYCDDQHLWQVQGKDDRAYRIENTATLVNSFASQHYKVPALMKSVQFTDKNVSIDPYVIGALVDSNYNKGYGIHMETEVGYAVEKVASLTNTKIWTYDDNPYHFYFVKYANNERINHKTFFKKYPDLCRHTFKIPEVYLCNSYQKRIRLLQGLFDVNGTINPDTFEVKYHSSSKEVAHQIQYLFQSLGYNARIDVEFDIGDKYSAYLYPIIPNTFKQNLFTDPIRYKIAIRSLQVPDKYRPPYVYIVDISLVKKAKTQCIRVSASDNLFLTEQFVVTHNTFMACYSAIEMGLKTLIITPTSGIKEQWADTLKNMFHVDPSNILLMNSPDQLINNRCDFVVTTQASLNALNKRFDLEKVLRDNKFGIKIIDEVQMWFKNIIQVDACSNIFLNWYLTGTFGRSGDEENRLYQKMFGDLKIFREKDKNPTLFNRKPGNIYGMKPYINCNMVWGHSKLSPEQIKSVTSSMRYSEREGKWIRYGISVPAYTKLVIPSDGTMTPLLKTILETVKVADRKVQYGRMLILCATIASANVVAQYCKQMFPKYKVGTIHSYNSKDENIRTKAEADILVSTVQSAGTGFDVKDLAKLILIQPLRSWILTNQIAGRLRRRTDEKECWMWDVVDADIPQLRAWANARADVLRKKCKHFKVTDKPE